MLPADGCSTPLCMGGTPAAPSRARPVHTVAGPARRGLVGPGAVAGVTVRSAAFADWAAGMPLNVVCDADGAAASSPTNGAGSGETPQAGTVTAATQQVTPTANRQENCPMRPKRVYQRPPYGTPPLRSSSRSVHLGDALPSTRRHRRGLKGRIRISLATTRVSACGVTASPRTAPVAAVASGRVVGDDLASIVSPPSPRSPA